MALNLSRNRVHMCTDQVVIRASNDAKACGRKEGCQPLSDRYWADRVGIAPQEQCRRFNRRDFA
jgi:hypothetical protein